jgi:hypothetical protein
MRYCKNILAICSQRYNIPILRRINIKINVGLKKNMTTYGHRQLSFFFIKLLDVSEDGFSYKGKNYTWDVIKGIEVTRGSFALNAMIFPAGTPKAKVTLSDGSRININGRALERVGKPPKIDKLSGESDAFVELIDLLESRSNC